MRYAIKITGILLAMMLAGCGSENDSNNITGNNSAKPYVTTTVDASSQDEWQYYSFASGKLVAESDDWHIAFRRYDVRLNDSVEGAIGDEQAEYYDGGSPVVDSFVNATVELEEQSLYNVIDDSGLNFEASGAEPYIDSSWYNYNYMTHTMTAESDNYWVLRSSSGDSYALMHASDIDASYNATFEFFVQADGETAFSDTPVSITVPLTTEGETCYDFDDDASKACSGSDWDVMFDMASRSYRIWINGGAGPDGDHNGDAAAYGAVAENEYSSGSELISHAWSQDKQASVFSSYSWNEYGVNGGHQIWPNFRVYVLDADKNSTADPLLKLQLINYYDATGTSGHVTFRYMDLKDDGNDQE